VTSLSFEKSVELLFEGLFWSNLRIKRT